MVTVLNESPGYQPIMRGHRPTSRKGKICSFLRERGKKGATVDEIATRLGLLQQQVSPRVSELARKNIIHINGEKRVTRTGYHANVYQWGSLPRR